MSIPDDLLKLQQLLESGAIDEEEYAAAKSKLLASSNSRTDEDNLEQQTRQWALVLHLSQFAGYVVPFGGFIVPILIWQFKKDELPGLDEHGKNCVNWIISKLFYLTISILLCIVVIGIPMVIALALCIIVFPIIAAVKASSGETWKYPCAIAFFT